MANFCHFGNFQLWKCANFELIIQTVQLSLQLFVNSQNLQQFAKFLYRHCCIQYFMFRSRLKRSKRDKPKSVELYNQIGNFWRVKGDTQKSIECFRRALAVSPNNAEVLLNLVISSAYCCLWPLAGQTY